MDYVAKRFDPGIPVRANELICSMLAEAVGLATPAFRVIEDTDNELLFGSQIYADTGTSQAQMLAPAAPNSVALDQVSRIAAFDLFVGNPDRHLNNYLVRPQNGVDRILAMDFSHALLAASPPLTLPLPSSCKTILRGRHLRARWGFNSQPAKDCAARLGQLPQSTGRELVNQVPPGWLPGTLATVFVRWWESEQQSRAQQIVAGIDDGSLL